MDLGEERCKWGEEGIEATRREGILIPSSARRVATSGFDGDRLCGSVEQEKGEDDRGGGVGRLAWADGQLGRLAQWGRGFLSLPSAILFFSFF